MSGNFTLFLNDAGQPTGSAEYVKDVFPDVSLAPTNNTGFSTSAFKNPFNGFYGNDDAPKFGPKTLWFNSLSLITDPKQFPPASAYTPHPIYKIGFQENFPGVNAYLQGVCGLKSSNQTKYIELASAELDANPLPGIFITTTARRVAWIVMPDSGTTSTYQIVVDGVNGFTSSQNNALPVLTSGGIEYEIGRRHAVFVHASSNETKDIHTYGIFPSVAGANYKIQGVIVYFENSGANIDCYPGTTYVDKSKSLTSTGATLAFPAMGSSLGGRALVSKSAGGVYSTTALGCTMLQTIGVGASGGNQITVTTGTGGSYPVGAGLVALGTGASQVYVGSVLTQSTDTLTVGPTLSFGVSGLLYKAWQGYTNIGGTTSAISPISATFYQVKSIFGQSQITGFSNIYPGVTAASGLKYYSDPNGNYTMFGNNLGITTMNYSSPALGMTLAANTYFQIDGRFQACEIEFATSGATTLLQGSVNINGCFGFTLNSGVLSNSVKVPVFADAGPGWNSVVFNAGVSMGNWGIKSVTMYEKSNAASGISNGILAQIDVQQTLTSRTVVNASLITLGTWKRYYAEELYFKGGWGRGTTHSVPGTVIYYGSSTNGTLNFQYYGKNFTLLGQGGSFTMNLDGSPVGCSYGLMTAVATEGFHTLALTVTGVTTQVYALDVCRTYDEIENLQNVVGVTTSQFKYGNVKVRDDNNGAATDTGVRQFLSVDRLSGPFKVVSDSTNGTRIVILQDGFYSVSCRMRYTSAATLQVTKNASLLTGSIGNTQFNEVVAESFTPANDVAGSCSNIVPLKAGDVLRVQSNNGVLAVNGGLSYLEVTYLGEGFNG